MKNHDYSMFTETPAEETFAFQSDIAAYGNEYAIKTDVMHWTCCTVAL